MSETPSKIPAVEIAVRTDPGRDPDKQVNEDSATHVETKLGLLAIVCDGMGGHAGGKEASEMAVKTIVEIIEAAPAATTAGIALKRAIEEANAKIWSMPTAEAGYRPGSTVVAIIAHHDGIEIAHVGDSRLYLLHAGAISQVTRDHSMVQEMVDRNLIRAEDAAKHPDANKILRALGIGKEVEVDLRSEALPYVAGDIFVLCSDGLSDLVEPAEILNIASHPPAQAAGQLVDLANARGGHDNITAMIIRMKSSSTARVAPALMKTMPLTAHQAPADQGSGPTGTVVGAPLHAGGGVGAAGGGSVPGQKAGPAIVPTLLSPAAAPLPGATPQPQPQPVTIAAIPPAPAPSPPSSSRPSSVHGGRSRTGVIVLGIVLAVAALGILGGIVFVFMKPEHRHAVPIVDDPVREAAAPPVEEDAGEMKIAPAPTLLLPKSDGGGFWDPCGALKRAQERGDAGAAQIARLEAKCRQAGGNP